MEILMNILKVNNSFKKKDKKFKIKKNKKDQQAVIFPKKRMNKVSYC